MNKLNELLLNELKNRMGEKQFAFNKLVCDANERDNQEIIIDAVEKCVDIKVKQVEIDDVVTNIDEIKMFGDMLSVLTIGIVTAVFEKERGARVCEKLIALMGATGEVGQDICMQALDAAEMALALGGINKGDE